ncbi:MAG: hypothetical protein AAB674_02855 [Patescibacteria group bacterium]
MEKKKVLNIGILALIFGLLVGYVIMMNYVAISIRKEKTEAQKNQEKIQKTQNERDANILANKISYMRDKRTGLCFAYVYSNTGQFSMTEVCCEEAYNFLPDSQK